MLLLIGALSLFVAVVGAMAAARGSTEGALAGAVGGVVFAAVFYLDKRRARNKAALRARQNAERIDVLADRLGRKTFRLDVKGSSGVWMWALMAAVGGAMLAALVTGNQHPTVLTMALLWSFGMLFAVMGTFMLIGVLLVIGEPVLSLTSDGIKMPYVPLIPWAAITGMHLREQRSKGSLVFHTLEMQVPSLAEEARLFCWHFRALYALRFGEAKRRLIVMLKDTSEAPEVVFEIARRLWYAKTGRGPQWNPGMPEDFNRTMRELSALQEMLSKGEMPSLDQANAALQLLNESRDEMERDLRSRRRKAQVVIAIAVVFVIACLVVFSLGTR